MTLLREELQKLFLDNGRLSASKLTKMDESMKKEIQRESGLEGIRDGIYFLMRGYRVCDRCGVGKTKIWPKFLDKKWYCSDWCRWNGRPTRIQSEEEILKRKKTNLERYGVECPPNCEKKTETMIRKYGVANPSQVPEIRKRMMESRSKTVNNPEYRLARKKKFLDEMGLSYEGVEDSIITEIPVNHKLPREFFAAFLNKFEGHTVESPIFDCRAGLATRYNDLRKVGRTFKKMISQRHQEMIDFVSSIGVKYKINDRKFISPYEIDILAERFAIEINGSYWHSEKKYGKDYHQNKSLLCEERGIHLFHVFDWDDICEIKELILKYLRGDLLYEFTEPKKIETVEGFVYDAGVIYK